MKEGSDDVRSAGNKVATAVLGATKEVALLSMSTAMTCLAIFAFVGLAFVVGGLFWMVLFASLAEVTELMSPWWAQGLAICWIVVMARVLVWLRASLPKAYARVEMFGACALAAVAAPPEASATLWLAKLVSALYMMVRALDNLKRANEAAAALHQQSAR